MNLAEKIELRRQLQYNLMIADTMQMATVIQDHIKNLDKEFKEIIDLAQQVKNDSHGAYTFATIQDLVNLLLD